MNLLWIATKAPWPPVDGGRLLLWETLAALRARGHRLALVAPITPQIPEAERRVVLEQLATVCEPHLVPRRAPGRLRAGIRGLLSARPATLVRHEAPEVVDAARRLVAHGGFDVAVAEQLHAYPQARSAVGRGLAVVVRAQNVESDLWRDAAERSLAGRWLLRAQARRLAQAEGRMLAAADAVTTVSREDARRLHEIGGLAVEPVVVHPPFPRSLPAAPSRLEGSPSLVVLGSAGWIPNRDSLRWFLAALWPGVHRAFPQAVLHVFGAPRLSGDAVVGHPSPADSAEAFAPGSVLVVPLRVASGIRMKVLEAWARGVPVIATPVAARGLAEGSDDAILVADDERELIAAMRRLERPGEIERVVAAGRRVLAEHHDPAEIAARWERLLTETVAAHSKRSRAAG
jgi:hypothetical protein